MSYPQIFTLDLKFQDTPSVIASYLLPHDNGAALIESGPGSTLANLKSELKKFNITPKNITDVFLTHIHLDHAGAAGWLARNGSLIHVHPLGAPHLSNPEKLLSSAARIYGEKMEPLWGDFLPVPDDKISILVDNQMVESHGLRILPLFTPGHATHHICYLVNDVCFSGDVGGVRIGNAGTLRVPMPPPDFNLEIWRISLEKIFSYSFKAIAPTHFGIYSDISRHYENIIMKLDQVEQWMETNLNETTNSIELRNTFTYWNEIQNKQDGFDKSTTQIYELANPAFMSADGILRYWKKFHQSPNLSS